MGTNFRHTAFFEHDDRMRFANRAEPNADHNRRACRPLIARDYLDRSFRFCVELRSWLRRKSRPGRIVVDRPRNSDALLFHQKAQSRFADLVSYPSGKRMHELVRSSA